MRRIALVFKRCFILLLILLAGPVIMRTGGQGMSADWRTASREPMGEAPAPATTPQAVVRIYAARAFGWRGAFGVHPWVAVKPAGADSYRIYQVIGWRARYGQSVVVVSEDHPDRRWFGAEPDLLFHAEGDKASALIPRIDAAARSYPYADRYSVWPGPNSNTFVSWIARQVPELKLDLPPTAIGKDFTGGQIVGKATSGTGVQFSLFGLLGVTAAVEEGLEVNVAGLVFGIDPLDLNLKLPGIGRVGPTPDPHR